MTRQRPLTILLIDDTAEDRALYRRLLHSAAASTYIFLEAAIGEEGLRLCETARPDCLRIDFHLPDMTGSEFLGALQAETVLLPYPVLRLTGPGSEQIAVQAMHGGVEGYLVQSNLSADTLRRAISNLQQVVTNLLINAHQALRASSAPRQLRLRTRCNPARTCVTFEAADTAPGISPALQARIFEPFCTTKPRGVGTGLGLSLCQGIIDGHDGTLSVMSQPGQGATFCVELPVEARTGTVSEPSGLDSQPAVPAKVILIVDDEPSITRALGALLRRDGYDVEMAADGRLALAKLQERPYDLLLSDLHMPELDGLGLYRALECHYPHLLQRVIFFTGDTLDPETRRFLEQSGAPCLTKPCTGAEIRRVVQQMLRAA